MVRCAYSDIVLCLFDRLLSFIGCLNVFEAGIESDFCSFVCFFLSIFFCLFFLFLFWVQIETWPARDGPVATAEIQPDVKLGSQAL